MEGNGERPFTPPYYAFRTLTNTLTRMEEHGPPPRVDRTVLKHMSNQGQTQFMSGLRALGLIDEAGVTQERLVELVSSPNERPGLIAELLRERYPEAIALEKNATTGMLQEVFEGYGVKGDTQRKAIAFFLNAAEYAGISVSPNFRVPSVPSSPKRRGARAAPPSPPAVEQNGGGGESTPLPGKLHPALVGMLREIPAQGAGWESADRRDAFITTFEAALRFLVPVAEGGAADDGPAAP